MRAIQSFSLENASNLTHEFLCEKIIVIYNHASIVLNFQNRMAQNFFHLKRDTYKRKYYTNFDLLKDVLKSK